MERTERTECANCGEPVKTEAGELELNEDGLCEECQDREELGKIRAEDNRRYMDFDYSMNG